MYRRVAEDPCNSARTCSASMLSPDLPPRLGDYNLDRLKSKKAMDSGLSELESGRELQTLSGPAGWVHATVTPGSWRAVSVPSDRRLKVVGAQSQPRSTDPLRPHSSGQRCGRDVRWSARKFPPRLTGGAQGMGAGQRPRAAKLLQARRRDQCRGRNAGRSARDFRLE